MLPQLHSGNNANQLILSAGCCATYPHKGRTIGTTVTPQPATAEQMQQRIALPASILIKSSQGNTLLSSVISLTDSITPVTPVKKTDAVRTKEKPTDRIVQAIAHTVPFHPPMAMVIQNTEQLLTEMIKDLDSVRKAKTWKMISTYTFLYTRAWR